MCVLSYCRARTEERAVGRIELLRTFEHTGIADTEVSCSSFVYSRVCCLAAWLLVLRVNAVEDMRPEAGLSIRLFNSNSFYDQFSLEQLSKQQL